MIFALVTVTPLEASLLVINAILPSIAVVALNNVATGPPNPFFLYWTRLKRDIGLEITLVTCNSLAIVILFAM